MKIIHMNKLGAVMEMKFRALFSKNFISMPIFALGFALVMKWVYGSIMSKEGISDELRVFVMSYSAIMNVTMSGIYSVSALMAEEKEKHTLRVLMTSSVNGLEFCLGSMIPVILVMISVNIMLVPLIGVSMSAAGWGAYIGVTVLSCVTSAMIGMIFGIFAKNQMSAGTITMPALLILMMIPMFSAFNQTLEKVSEVLFTGVLMQTISNVAGGTGQLVSIKSILVMIVEIVLAVGCFLMFYRKNGYDHD